MTDSNITRIVQEKYASTASSSLSSEHKGVAAIAQAFGYSSEELTSIPAQAHMGLSCGNPIATANLKPGEVVVDLGSGGGLDVFLAARKVGPTGKAIGIDMTPAMIDRARKAAAQGVHGQPFDNVEFHLAPIDDIPLPDASVDIIISNCVINLAPDKKKVFAEMMRILKPGGRVAVSDIALKKPLPDALAKDIMAYVGCIAGAIPIDQFEQGLREAGFNQVAIIDSQSDLNAYALVDGQAACCSPASATQDEACCGDDTSGQDENSLSLQISTSPVASSCCTPAPQASADSGQIHQELSALLAQHDINDYAASVKVFAIKPA